MEKISKKGFSLLGAVIVALVVGHFVMQLYLIDRERSRSAGLPGRVESPAKEVIPVQPEIAATVERSTEPVQPQKNGDVVSVQRETSHRPVPVSQLQTASKERVRSKARSERLRRAEKILTGF